MKKLIDEIIYIDSEEKFKEVKENYRREQAIYYTCSNCGKKFIKSTIRAMTSMNKVCCTCASKQAVLQKYGVENVFQLDKFKEKIKETNLKKYGSENPFAFGSEKYNSYIKEKYGVDNVFQSEDIKQKIRKTCKEKYGDEFAVRTESVKEKIKQTCIKRYGVESTLSSPEIRHRIESTNLERYGSKVACPFGSEKQRKIIKDKYGVDNVSQLESVKRKKEETCLKHYGTDNPFKVDSIKNQIKDTLIEKYGVEHPLQNPELFKKSKNKYFYDDINFDSSWELAFWIYNKNFLHKNIKKETTHFKYEYNGEEFIYFPDFEIDGQFYEIKGDHFFENGKMINPWNRDEDEKAQAKFECMIQNHVNILTYKDVEICLNWVACTYGNDYISSFRRN